MSTSRSKPDDQPLQVKLTIGFYHDELDPDEVTRLLGTMPDEAWRRGERRESIQSRPVTRAGAWLIHGESTHKELSTEPSALTEMIGRIDAIEARRLVQEGVKGTLRVGIFGATPLKTTMLTSETVSRIGAIGLSILIDTYP